MVEQPPSNAEAPGDASLCPEQETDVLVVGAGPTGCAAALAFRQTGARVTLVDAQPGAARRFAGEWMHPPAVRALRSLGVDTERLAAAEGHGFVLFGEGGAATEKTASRNEEPVQLPYVRGTGLARLHHELVEELRDYVVDTDGIEYLPYHAFSGIAENRPGSVLVQVEDRKAGRMRLIRAHRVIGADGRKSKVAAAIGVAPTSAPVSYMMGVELRDVTLPYEGLGHVIFGGPGPALLYRVDDHTVRGCLDVPVSFGSEARKPAAVFDAFAPVLPADLVPAFRTSLEHSTPWAATRFQPRGTFGVGSVWLAGDAVGHVHPVSGMGMTFGILDAVAAARAVDLDDYRAAREVYVSELLTNVLYLVFRRHDESAIRVRRALLRMLRRHPEERRRTMQILTSEDNDGTSFARSFLRASGYAVSDSVLAAARQGDGSAFGGAARLALALRSDVSWLKWPLSAVVSDMAGSSRYRSLSSIESPLPPVEELLGPMSDILSERATSALRSAGPLGRLALEAIPSRGAAPFSPTGSER